MALYIKANKKVAEFLNLTKDRFKTNDGNYILWQGDMLQFGNMIDLTSILKQIGGIALRASEAKEEQDGIVLRNLPEPEDDRFKIEVNAPEFETGGEEEESEVTGEEAEEEGGDDNE